MANKKYDLFKEPYIRKADYKYYGTDNIMIDFIISLLPVILIGWYQNGVKVFVNNKSIYSLLYPLIFILLGTLFTYLIEVLYFYFYDKNNSNYNCFEKSWKSYSIIPGLLLSIILPLKTPIWVLLFGCIFAIIIGKLIYGGFGHNIFNPALIGYIFVMTAFYGAINNSSLDIISSATPLQDLNNVLFHNTTIEEIIKNNNGIINTCFGLKTGTIGETSSIACFISLIYLYVRKVVDIKTPIIILITFFISSFLVGIFIDVTPTLFSLFNLFNGGIIFGAIFMATEPVTSPRSYYGKIIYAFFIGVIALVLRLLSDLRDGTSTAILFMNALAILIDLFGAKLRVENRKNKILLKVSILFIIYIITCSYSVLKLNSYKVSNDDNIEQINISILKIEQDYEKLKEDKVEFIYKININNNELLINADIDGEILTPLEQLNELEYQKLQEEIIKNKVNKRSINQNKHYGYIQNIKKTTNENYVITSLARGYFDNVIIIAEYQNGNIINISVDLSKETELSGGLANSTGNKNDLINIGTGEKSDIVSGVTYTSVSLISARTAIMDYINYLSGGTKNE